MQPLPAAIVCQTPGRLVSGEQRAPGDAQTLRPGLQGTRVVFQCSLQRLLLPPGRPRLVAASRLLALRPRRLPGLLPLLTPLCGRLPLLLRLPRWCKRCPCGRCRGGLQDTRGRGSA